MQEEIGLPAATDGEFRRTSWHMDFIYQLDGVSQTDEKIAVHFRNAQGDLDFTSAALKVDGRIDIGEPIFGKDFQFLQSVVSTAVPKLTIPSPSMVHYRGGAAAIDKSVYPDEAQFWDDLSAAYAKQVAGIAALGGTYLQLDDTSLAYLNDPAQRAMLASQGRDAEHQHERYIRQINTAIGDRPESLHVTTHMCRGNYRSSWAAEGGYDFVAEALFGQLDVDGFFLEYDDARSGDFAPLRFVPPGKFVVLGLITTKSAELESKDALKRRIDEAAATSRWSSCACHRSAGSPRPSRATCSPATSRSPSCAWSSRPPRRSGASDAETPPASTSLRCSAVPLRAGLSWKMRGGLC